MMSDIDYKYKCDACNHIFKKSDHLARHKEDNHLNNKKNILICKVCFKSFVNLKYLKAHSQRHLENRSKMCVICKIKFVDLKRHILLQACLPDFLFFFSIVASNRQQGKSRKQTNPAQCLHLFLFFFLIIYGKRDTGNAILNL